MRLALETNTPIVPIAVVGSEEQQPGFANWGLGRLLGMPAFPVTPPGRGSDRSGCCRCPVKYRIYFGEPLTFEGDPDDEDGVIEERSSG